MHAAGKTLWAACHVVGRHSGWVEDVIVLTVNVPRRWLRRSKRGLWYCPCDIPPERIRGVVTFAALARSPLERLTGPAA